MVTMFNSFIERASVTRRQHTSAVCANRPTDCYGLAGARWRTACQAPDRPAVGNPLEWLGWHRAGSVYRRGRPTGGHGESIREGCRVCKSLEERDGNQPALFIFRTIQSARVLEAVDLQPGPDRPKHAPCIKYLRLAHHAETLSRCRLRHWEWRDWAFARTDKQIIETAARMWDGMERP